MDNVTLPPTDRASIGGGPVSRRMINDRTMMRTRTLTTRLLLLAAAAAVIVWTLLRSGQGRRGTGDAEVPRGDVRTAPAEVASADDSDQRRESFRRASGTSPAEPDPGPATADPDAELARRIEVAPGQLIELRATREGLYQELSREKDPVVDEVEKTLAAAGLATPATVAAGWRLVQNWRVFLLAEAASEARVEDPRLREELSRARRTILVDAAVREFTALAEGPPPASLLAELEAQGRRLAATGEPDARTRALLVPPPPPKTPRPRRVELDPE